MSTIVTQTGIAVPRPGRPAIRAARVRRVRSDLEVTLVQLLDDLDSRGEQYGRATVAVRDAIRALRDAEDTFANGGT